LRRGFLHGRRAWRSLDIFQAFGGKIVPRRHRLLETAAAIRKDRAFDRGRSTSLRARIGRARNYPLPDAAVDVIASAKSILAHPPVAQRFRIGRNFG
jgi:hypothetical protein